MQKKCSKKNAAVLVAIWRSDDNKGYRNSTKSSCQSQRVVPPAAATLWITAGGPAAGQINDDKGRGMAVCTLQPPLCRLPVLKKNRGNERSKEFTSGSCR